MPLMPSDTSCHQGGYITYTKSTLEKPWQYVLILGNFPIGTVEKLCSRNCWTMLERFIKF
jgi:hypothetical protein